MAGRKSTAARGRAQAAPVTGRGGAAGRGTAARGRGAPFAVGHVLQARLDEEAEMRAGEVPADGADIAPFTVEAEDQPVRSGDDEEEEETIKGNPTSKAVMALWPSWRCKFFKDWRDGPRPDGDPTKPRPVWGICILCNNGKQFSGNTAGYTNLANHVKNVHSKDWEAFMNPKSSGGPIQPKIEKYASTSTKMTSARQDQLDAALARVFSECASIPLILLRNKVFQEWVEVI